VKKLKRTARKTGAVNHKKIKVGGVEFSSALEKYCYSQLKSAGLDFGYESDKFEVLKSTVYTGKYYKSSPKAITLADKQGKKVLAVTYTPDFVSHTHKFIIETKGYVPSQHSFPIRWKLFMHHLQLNGMGDYMLFLPKNKSQVDETIKIITDAITHD
jgi:hypothetical protein